MRKVFIFKDNHIEEAASLIDSWKSVEGLVEIIYIGLYDSKYYIKGEDEAMLLRLENLSLGLSCKLTLIRSNNLEQSLKTILDEPCSLYIPKDDNLGSLSILDGCINFKEDGKFQMYSY